MSSKDVKNEKIFPFSPIFCSQKNKKIFQKNAKKYEKYLTNTKVFAII